MKLRDLDKRTMLVLAGLAAAGGVIAAVLVVAFGLFNVSARQGHLPGVTWVLHTTFENSVKLRAPPDSAVPDDLDTPEMVALGAGHYRSACMGCHGAPGVPRSATVRQMLPVPPRLSDAAEHWTAPEMHWIVRNGIKMSGMPAWPAEREDDIWPVVAFLRGMQGMDAPTWAEMTSQDAGQCAMCHGARGVSRNAQVPRLDILSEPYIARSLAAYKTGARDSGIMREVMSEVPDAAIAGLAAKFASVAPEGEARSRTVLFEKGRALAFAESGSQSVPACRACHGPWSARINPAFPSLAGQHAPYLSRQLKLWREGNRGGGPEADMMFRAARDLTDADIEALVAYYAGLAPAELNEVAE